ncbi:MAG TPA: hypothetical protein VGV35_07835 [Bryobacteraceae bacterium]|nr:hypothetical protein [Bryobacteraceae bacterium]
MNGCRQAIESLRHRSAILRYQTGIVLLDVRECPEAIHLQFEEEVLVVEGIVGELRIGWNESR